MQGTNFKCHSNGAFQFMSVLVGEMYLTGIFKPIVPEHALNIIEHIDILIL